MLSAQFCIPVYALLHACRMIATLFDLQSNMCHEEKVPDFDTLHMGPLVQMPLVRSLFQIPTGQTEIIQVCSPTVCTTAHAPACVSALSLPGC